MIKRFDTMADFIADCDSVKAGNWYNRKGGDFNGYQSYSDSLKEAVTGRPENVTEAEKMMDLIDDEGLSIERSSWSLDVAGAFPLVAAAIAGDPLNMFTPSSDMDQFTPVKIYASACCSGAISAQSLVKRGVAILALALKLSAIRPVELYVTADMEGSRDNGGSAVPCIKIDLLPLDMQAATTALTSAGFLRNLLFHWGSKHGFTGAWAYNKQPTDAEYDRRMREELGLSEDDIYIRGGHANDKSIEDPVAWVQEQLDRFRPEEF